VSSLLPKSSPAKSAECVEQPNKATSSSEILNENQKKLIRAAKEKFKADQGFFVKKVNALLKEFSQEKGVSLFLFYLFSCSELLPCTNLVPFATKSFLIYIGGL
jgi:hypothetical protein